MESATPALTRQFLEWLDVRPRSRAEVLDVWRTNCPRLTVWEDACIDGLVESAADGGAIQVSARGRDFLASRS